MAGAGFLSYLILYVTFSVSGLSLEFEVYFVASIYRRCGVPSLQPLTEIDKTRKVNRLPIFLQRIA